MRRSSNELGRVHPNGPRLMRPGREHLNSPVESLAPSLLMPQLILSLSDGLRRSMTLCLGRGPPLSEYECLKLLQLRNMLLRRTTQEPGQGLFTKSLRH